uniref:(northern house mosquito) hypothetical protein n=1 Tax=Culex pipiens TaxID=7175 RepID=A0A8D8H1G2_CULPI
MDGEGFRARLEAGLQVAVQCGQRCGRDLGQRGVGALVAEHGRVLVQQLHDFVDVRRDGERFARDANRQDGLDAAENLLAQDQLLEEEVRLAPLLVRGRQMVGVVGAEGHLAAVLALGQQVLAPLAAAR